MLQCGMQEDFSHFTDAIQQQQGELTRRQAWSPWREQRVILPRRDIKNQLIWGRIYTRQRWTLDPRTNHSQMEQQHVGNVFDMLRAGD